MDAEAPGTRAASPIIPLAAAPHEREAERLAALARYRILDTPREPAFDDLAALASEICEAPIAVVNLIAEHRQWFKAEVGLGVRETPLDTSFCAHAILESDFLEVPDATKDPRFECNPLVTGEPGLRFYAGALLKTEEGLPIGSLCVLDTKPRRLSEQQARALRRLAQQAMSQLELRQALRARMASEERLRFLDRLAEAAQLLTDATEIMAATARLLGEHLGVAVCAYADMEPDQDGFTIRGDWTAPGAPSIVGTYSLAGFGETAVRELRAGRALVTRDTLAELGPEQAALFLQLGLRATICMPLVKDGRLTALMAVHAAAPRDWTKDDLALVADTTERSWAHIERTRSEAARIESEGRFEALAENVSQLAWMAESDGHIFWYNKRWYDYTGTTLATMLGWGWRDVHHPDHVEHVIAEVGANWARGEAWEGTYLLRGQDGVYRPFLTRAEPIRDEAGRLLRWFGTNTDITAQRRAEEALRELNETLEAQVAARTAERDRIWQLSPDLMCVARTDGTLLSVNPAWEAVLGWSLDWLAGRNAAEIKHPEDAERTDAELTRLAAGGHRTLGFEDRYRTKDGAWRWLSWAIEPEGDLLYCIGRDVTVEKERQLELERAQEALRQSQKLEVVGQLTGGVAHDFNNLLTIIKSSTDLLRRPGLADERRRRYVDAISDTVDRASKLTGQLLAFARRQALKPEVFDVAHRIQAITEMLRTIVGSRIQIVTDVSNEPCFVEADASQFETALVNMTVNARDAMDGDGTLTVRIRPADAMPDLRRHRGGPGSFVAVSLTDTGQGIPEDKLAQIFEPFFTTKEVGKGTGLGLSQVYGFAKQSGGDVEVESTVGQGTTFTLYLPRSDGQGLADGAVSVKPVPAVEDGGGRRVLVVEDNQEVGAFSTQVLQDLGYETTWAGNADEALKLLAEMDGFDVVFSDVVMPGMSGVELGEEIRRRYPGLPVVLTSGYSHVLAEEGRHGFELIHKPYAAENLSKVLRRVTRGRAQMRA